MEDRGGEMSGDRLILQDVGKRFNRRVIFRGVTVDVGSPGSVALTGRNGSGKSTLAKIMAKNKVRAGKP